MENKSKKIKVFVGLSGGVDSSVSAALLKEQGYDVTGVFIKVWQPDFFECAWRQDRLDAMRVCAKLDIPFFTLNLEDEYKKEVVDYMINEYKAGRTPNPDVMCNKYVKFGGFFNWAIAQGADFVATGHYAQVRAMEISRGGASVATEAPPRGIRAIGNQGLSLRRSRATGEGESLVYKYELLAGTDANKDQSYFLWTLTQEQLSKILFPVGNIEKPQVRKLAEKFGLATAIKKDSQGLCFIGKIDMKDFLKNYIEEKKGDVLNEKGDVIGTHDGAFFLTIGQRHGFTITEKTPNDLPYYIITKNIGENTITVSQDAKKIIESDAKIITLRNINWTLGEHPDLSKTYAARIRYRAPLEECKIKKMGNTFELHFINVQKAVTPGQSAVLYDGEICLGGGIIF